MTRMGGDQLMGSDQKTARWAGPQALGRDLLVGHYPMLDRDHVRGRKQMMNR